MSDQSPNLSLPYIMAAQAQKHVTHNEAIRMLDALVQLTVISRTLAAPPASPVEGERYIVASGATVAWAGQSGRIAAFQDGAWEFFTPRAGWLAWIATEAALVVWNGSSWIETGGSSNPTPLVGVNATADTTNRLAVSSPASLFSHEGAGHQQKINKAAAGDTASLLFQTGFSGRAEMGTTGDDDFRVKVSPKGSTWQDAIVVNRSTGRVSLPLSAATFGANNLLHLTGNGFLHYNVTGIQRLPPTTIADDAVLVYDAPDLGAVFGSIVFFKCTTNALTHGLLWVRATTSPVTTPVSMHGLTAGYHNTALTGTTGTDGRINFGADTAGNFYIENRLGYGISVSAWMHI